jgi:hypothetical protein
VNLNPLDHKLVDGWRSSWRWTSVQLAAAGALVLGAVLANPLTLLQAIGSLPLPVRLVLAFAWFVLWLASRLWKQSHPGKPK